MTKDVLLSISGMQLQEDENQKTETITTGNYYKKDDKHYIMYDEIIEGFHEPIKNIVKFKSGVLSLQKKGPVTSNMLFEENKRNLSNYVTPYGVILMGVDAKRIDLEETDNRIVVHVEYELEMNYEHLANCKLSIDIQSKQDAQLIL